MLDGVVDWVCGCISAKNGATVGVAFVLELGLGAVFCHAQLDTNRHTRI